LFVDDVIVLKFFGAKCLIVMYPIMSGAPLARNMLDEVNDGSILRQGASLATNDSLPRDSPQDDPTASTIA
jgi:hypothetical protein